MASRLLVLGFLISLLTGCSYSRGDLTYASNAPNVPPRDVHTAGRCVDLALDRVTYRPETSHVVVDYVFGNACDEDAPLDLATASVRGRTADGREIPLGLDEPAARNVRIAPLEARDGGHELLHYAAAEPVTSVCIEIAGVPERLCRDAAPPCACAREANDNAQPNYEVLGSRFAADWASESKLAALFDAGIGYASIQTEHLHLGDSYIGKFRAASLGPRIGAGSFELRGSVRINAWLSLGYEGALGGGGVPITVLRADPGVTTSGEALHIHMGAIVGVTSPRLGPFAVRGEILGGGRLYDVFIEEQRYGCTHDGCRDLSGAAWMAQPKAILDAWLGPRFTLSVFAGADLVHPGDWTTGFYLGVHARANDGRLHAAR